MAREWIETVNYHTAGEPLRIVTARLDPGPRGKAVSAHAAILFGKPIQVGSPPGILLR